MKKRINFAIGAGFLALGIIGAFLPVLPSTCFFICAAYYFGKSSTRIETWMLNHPKFGYAIRSWRETQSIPLAGKIAAILSMAVSGLFLTLSPAPLWLIGSGIIVLIFSAGYVLSRPTLAKKASALHFESK